DGGVAWQLVAGLRYALNPNVDLGVKYRYFHPSKITEEVDPDVFFRGKMHSHSLLATLTYNFYTPPPPPPPPMLPPPPPPPPATQTCPDGSVILATDACPPPPPPPPPPAPVERGERGR
ncbi:MAG: outer membrane protein, partial [Sphingomicrobium sp.]